MNISAQNIDQFNENRLDITKSGMIVLGSWAVINIASSPILSSQSKGSRKYFHQMNGYWNVVNLALAGSGLYGAITGNFEGLSVSETLTEQLRLEKILLFNSALDIGYMLGGLYLIERSKNTGKNPERLKGFGQSVILQGGFLFAFDLIFYAVLNNHGKGLMDIIDKVAVSPEGFSLIMSF